MVEKGYGGEKVERRGEGGWRWRWVVKARPGNDKGEWFAVVSLRRLLAAETKERWLGRSGERWQRDGLTISGRQRRVVESDGGREQRRLKRGEGPGLASVWERSPPVI